ncbi:conserved hypothetical protein [Rhodopseudomonas palustris TIE-1]|uniref:hypothetical protein n=1 Tax=Rhodopseudomonas palustris TaxID=1076 RepID=UPI000164A824|nr:hypothetical protein [Rhodopseudomonas palustris]ACF01565.1 conserved hypothetical protein [Rhodopseudomonas palustris TIE-1]
MAAFNKFDQFGQDAMHKVHHLGADDIAVMLSNVAPVRTNKVKADITEIAPGNGYTAGGIIANRVSSGQTSGLYKLVLSPVQWTANSGSIATFQYSIIYNKTTAAGNLIGWYDYGAPVIITNGNNFLENLDQVNGLIQFQ